MGDVVRKRHNIITASVFSGKPIVTELRTRAGRGLP